VTGIPENPDKKKFGGSRAGKRERKRLDELTGIFSRRVVSRPVKVTAMGYIEQRSCAIVQIPAKIRPMAVTLAQEE